MGVNAKFQPGDKAVLMIDIYKQGASGRKEKDFFNSIRFPALKTIVKIVGRRRSSCSEYIIEIVPGVQRVIKSANLERLEILDQIFGEGYCRELGV